MAWKSANLQNQELLSTIYKTNNFMCMQKKRSLNKPNLTQPEKKTKKT